MPVDDARKLVSSDVAKNAQFSGVIDSAFATAPVHKVPGVEGDVSGSLCKLSLVASSSNLTRNPNQPFRMGRLQHSEVALNARVELGGDPSASGFASYYATHRGWLVSLIARSTPNKTDVEDLCAEVFACAFEKHAHVGDYGVGQQRRWLYEAAQREMMRHVRAWNRRQRLLERAYHESTSESSDPFELLLASEARADLRSRCAEVRQLLKLMRDNDLAILEMAASGMNGPAIAAQLEISHQSARTRLMLARRRFFQEWATREGQ